MREHEQVFVEDIAQLSSWLQENHQQKESVWLVRYKKGIEDIYISYDELVDELICFGWVDSLPKSLDDEKTMIRISPRNPKSNWSKVNKERVRRLLKAGKMKSSGLRLVEMAKQNGAWDFLNDVEELILPQDLLEALQKNQKAKEYFERFPNSSKRNILEWIKSAKQATTRQKRIAETVSYANKNLKANHPKGRNAGPKSP